MTRADDDGRRGPLPETPAGPARLAAHAEECEACRSAPPPLARITAALEAGDIRVDAAAISHRVLIGLRPELERCRRRVLWRRIAAGVLLALAPFPVVLASDAYLLLLAYDAVSALLPAAFAAYLVLSYAAGLVLLFASTYAAIPIALARQALPATRHPGGA
jgi:hypothetical protein